jgi:outer membrane protein assembly factor BamB
LLTDRQLHEDADHWYGVLGHEFAATPLGGGKTGADLCRDAVIESRFEPGAPWRIGTLRVESTNGDPRAPHPLLHLLPQGETLPFFRGLDLALETNQFRLKLFDRAQGKERGSQALTRSPVYFNLLSTQLPRCTYQTAGHIVIVNIGHMVYGYDPLSRKLLWEKNLLGAAATTYHILPDGDGGFRAFFADGRVQTLGRIGPVEPGFVCIQTHDGLMALDPLSGDVLWTRSDCPDQAEVFGDYRRIYYVRSGLGGEAEAAHALRASDGGTVAAADFSGAFNAKHQVCGGSLLLTETDAAGALVLRLHEPGTGKDLWKQAFSPRARVLHSDDPNLTGVVEPERDGKLTVYDLRTRSVVLSAEVQPRDLERVDRIHLLMDGERFYVAMHAPVEATANLARAPLLGVVGMPALEVNGAVYAFERATGRLCWKNQVAHQLLVRQHFADLPVLLCVARFIRPVGAPVRQATAVQSFDKRTGELVFDKEYPNAAQFHSLRLHLPERRMELLGYAATIVYHMEGGETH